MILVVAHLLLPELLSFEKVPDSARMLNMYESLSNVTDHNRYCHLYLFNTNDPGLCVPFVTLAYVYIPVCSYCLVVPFTLAGPKAFHMEVVACPIVAEDIGKSAESTSSKRDTATIAGDVKVNEGRIKFGRHSSSHFHRNIGNVGTDVLDQGARCIDVDGDNGTIPPCCFFLCFS